MLVHDVRFVLFVFCKVTDFFAFSQNMQTKIVFINIWERMGEDGRGRAAGQMILPSYTPSQKQP